MIKRKQLFRHRPAEGTIGDCHRTAIACLLDVEPDVVPHFGALYFDDPAGFNQAFEDWLSARGYRTVVIAFQDISLAYLLESIGTQNKGAYYLLGGTSRTGVNHTVICCGCEIAHDPSLDDSGITGPCDDGYWWITFLVPRLMYAETGARPEVHHAERES